MSIKFKKVFFYIDVWNCFDRGMAVFDGKKIMC